MQEHGSDSERQRNRHHHHTRRAEPKWQQRKEHQRDRDAEIFFQATQPTLHILRLIEGTSQGDSRREFTFERCDGRRSSWRHVRDIGAVLHAGRNEHRAFAVVPRDVRGVSVPPLDGCHIAHMHHRTAGRADDGVAHLIQRRERAAGLHHELLRTNVHRSAGHIRTLTAQRAEHGRQRQVQRAQSAEVERYLYLAQGCANAFHFANARHGGQPIFQRAAAGVERGVRRRRRHQRILQNVHIAGVVADDIEQRNLRRQGCAQLIYFAQHVVLLLARD